MVPPSSSPASSPASAKGQTKGLGPCSRCGMRGHGYQQCPDRFSQGGFTGKSKGKSKFGWFKGKFGGWNEGER